MKTWKPKPRPGVDVTKLQLSMEAGFLLSRIDGATTLSELFTLTGMRQAQLLTAMKILIEQGAISLEGLPPEIAAIAQRKSSSAPASAPAATPAASATSATSARPPSGSAAKLVIVTAPPPSTSEAAAEPTAAATATPAAAEPVSTKPPSTEPHLSVEEVVSKAVGSRSTPIASVAPITTGLATEPVLAAIEPSSPSASIGLGIAEPTPAAEIPPTDPPSTGESVTSDIPLESAVEASGGGAEAEAEAEAGVEAGAPEDLATQDEPTEGAEAAESEDPTLKGDYRKIYEGQLHALSLNERTAMAHSAEGDVLFALCLDARPEVIHAVFENSHASVSHARLVAMHHHTASGLEVILGRAAFARDGQVKRMLLRNPQLSEAMLVRLLTGARLQELFKVVQSREITDQVRRGARNLFRQRFSSAPPEEKVELIFTTEGRMLTLLIGVPLDAKTASMLCERNYTSLLLVQNLGKWAPTPPQVLRHLLNQNIVMRNVPVKNLLKRHPNTPSDMRDK